MNYGEEKTVETSSPSKPRGLEQFVDRVERRLDELLDERGADRHTGSARIEQASRHLALAPAAKRARPRLVFHFGRCVGLDPRGSLQFAVAAELVHTASLLHDDVVDAGAERRGRETANERWNDVTAVLTGDALLCSALVELRGSAAAISERAVDVVAEMTRSILHEVASRRETDLDRDDWRFVASGKTGALFGWCGEAPALEVDDIATARRLEECGRRLGIAFQLADDLRDLMPVESGKDPYADLRNGHPSFPIICAIDQNPGIATRLDRLWNEAETSKSSSESSGELEGIAESIRTTDAIAETRSTIREEVNRALTALGPHAERPGGKNVADWARRLCARL